MTTMEVEKEFAGKRGAADVFSILNEKRKRKPCGGERPARKEKQQNRKNTLL